MSETGAQLFLRLSLFNEFTNSASLLETLLGNADIAWVLLESANTDDGAEDDIAALRDCCHERDVSLLIADQAEMAGSLGLDGVHLSDPSHYRPMREAIGRDGFIGVFCGSSRHFAMTVGESGADYVAFDTFGLTQSGESIIHWWSQMFEIPCAAFDPVSLDQLDKVLSFAPDFICPDLRAWQSPVDVSDGIKRFNDLMAERQIG